MILPLAVPSIWNHAQSMHYMCYDWNTKPRRQVWLVWGPELIFGCKHAKISQRNDKTHKNKVVFLRVSMLARTTMVRHTLKNHSFFLTTSKIVTDCQCTPKRDVITNAIKTSGQLGAEAQAFPAQRKASSCLPGATFFMTPVLEWKFFWILLIRDTHLLCSELYPTQSRYVEVPTYSVSEWPCLEIASLQK